MKLKYLGIEEVSPNVYRFKYSFDFILTAKLEEIVNDLPLSSIEDSYEEISKVIINELKEDIITYCENQKEI